MKIAIVGAGFTGLSAALKLLDNSQEVSVFEKEKYLGGLAAGFKKPGWDWALEKHYHHWFTNDNYALDLINKLGFGQDLLVPQSITSIYYGGKIYPFNSPWHVLSFSPLNIGDRLRTGLATLYLKLLPPSLAVKLERHTASSWLSKWYGQQAYSILWEPLLAGKFNQYKASVNMAWFWARIKKRTPKLAYLSGGYARLLEAMAGKIQSQKGKIYLNRLLAPADFKKFDKVIFTVPSPVFLKLFPKLPAGYKNNLNKIPHLDALNMVLITKGKFLQDTYWLNINDRQYPFIGLIQHTNMVDQKHYGNQHLLWIANYLPPTHQFFKLSKEELYKKYLPYLQKINPGFDFKSQVLGIEFFHGLGAQPVFNKNYSSVKPQFSTPLPNIYLANMDMVYPWDRGTNYAIELGYNVADFILNN